MYEQDRGKLTDAPSRQGIKEAEPVVQEKETFNFGYTHDRPSSTPSGREVKVDTNGAGRWRTCCIVSVALALLIVAIIVVVALFSGDEEAAPQSLSAAEISSYEIVSQGVYYRSNNLAWYEMTDYIEDELVDHFDSLRSVGYLTPGKIKTIHKLRHISMNVR